MRFIRLRREGYRSCIRNRPTPFVISIVQKRGKACFDRISPVQHVSTFPLKGKIQRKGPSLLLLLCIYSLVAISSQKPLSWMNKSRRWLKHLTDLICLCCTRLLAASVMTECHCERHYFTIKSSHFNEGAAICSYLKHCTEEPGSLYPPASRR